MDREMRRTPEAIKLGHLERRTAPSGATYLVGDLGNLRFSIVVEPNAQPTASGDVVYSVWARQADATKRQARRSRPMPDGDPFDLVQLPRPIRTRDSRADDMTAPDPSESTDKRPSKKSTLESRANDALDRIGRLDPGGDDIASLWPDEDEELQKAIALLETPLV